MISSAKSKSNSSELRGSFFLQNVECQELTENLDVKKEVKLSRLELDYLSSKRIGRLATVNKSGMPHVVPVIFSVGSHDRIVISGYGFEKSYKCKNILENPNVAFVVDSVKLTPWTPMGIELRGKAVVTTMGNAQKGIQIIPTKKATWGLTEETVTPNPPTSMGAPST
jgi:pyridoxamine 5'-phosphate oxidase family protein